MATAQTPTYPRLFIETACRRGGLVHLTLEDLNAEDCLVRLREKGGTLRWQPVSPTLMHRVLDHVQARGGPEATDYTVEYCTFATHEPDAVATTPLESPPRM